MSLLLPKTLSGDALKATGIHLGIKGMVSKDMARFVTEITPNGNPIMDIDTIISRLEAAGKFIAFSGEGQEGVKPVLYATDARFENALEAFNRATDIPTVYKRFLPGTLTNSQLPSYVDASILIVSDPTNGVPKKENQPPTGDCRAMQEASKEGIPVVAICDTNATFDNVDFCIPANNYGVRSIATIFYLLARSVLMASGWNGGDLTGMFDDIPLTIGDFETVLVKEIGENTEH